MYRSATSADERSDRDDLAVSDRVSVAVQGEQRVPRRSIDGRRVGGLRAWLFRIASAEVATWYRERYRTTGDRGRQAWRRGDRVPDTASDDDPNDQLTLLRAMATLPDRYREVITMRYLAEMTADEAADALGVSKRMLAVTLHRALGALRRAMVEHEGKP